MEYCSRMEPSVRYTHARDGTTIAFRTYGEGPPLVIVPGGGPAYAPDLITAAYRWIDDLAQTRTVIVYDRRGQGYSQRDAADLSLDAFVSDLEAVVSKLGIDRFALMSQSSGSVIAITYAAQHPEQVTHLILWWSYARAEDSRTSPRRAALHALIDIDWDLWCQTMALVDFGWSETAQEVAESRFRESREQYKTNAIQQLNVDLTETLTSVRCPALVMHQRGLEESISVEASMRLASNLADGSLVMFDNSRPIMFLGDWAPQQQVIKDFLASAGRIDAEILPGGTAVIMFADIVDSAALTESLGDAAFRSRARELDASMRTIIRQCGGSPVEGRLLGDGVLAVFNSAREAIDAAVRCSDAGDAVELQLHLGIHAGDVIREGDNVYGGTVNIASRIAELSAPNEILVSDTVRGLARTSAGVAFGDRGERALKGIAEPVRVFAVEKKAAG